MASGSGSGSSSLADRVKRELAVADQAAREGVADRPLSDPIQQVYERMWQPRYSPIEAV